MVRGWRRAVDGQKMDVVGWRRERNGWKRSVDELGRGMVGW